MPCSAARRNTWPATPRRLGATSARRSPPGSRSPERIRRPPRGATRWSRRRRGWHSPWCRRCAAGSPRERRGGRPRRRGLPRMARRAGGAAGRRLRDASVLGRRGRAGAGPARCAGCSPRRGCSDCDDNTLAGAVSARPRRSRPGMPTRRPTRAVAAWSRPRATEQEVLRCSTSRGLAVGAGGADVRLPPCASPAT